MFNGHQIQSKDQSKILALDPETLTINLEESEQANRSIILDGNGNLVSRAKNLFARVADKIIVMGLEEPEDDKWRLGKSTSS